MGVTINISDVSRKFAQMKKRWPVANARALNRASVSSRAAMVQVIAPDLGIKAAPVRDAITLSKATPSNLRSQVIAKGKKIPLIEFAAKGPEPTRGRGTGVAYRTKGGRGRIKDAFIATMSSGHRGVFKQKFPYAKGSRHHMGSHRSVGAWSPNLPIRELFGPSVPHIFTKHQQVGLKAGTESLRKNLQSEMRYVMGL